jgi:hypothetical protein
MALKHWVGLTGFAIAYAFIVALVFGLAPIDVHAGWQPTLVLARH